MIKSPIKELKDEADQPIRKTPRRLKKVLDRLNYEKEKKEKLKIDHDSACDDDRPGEIKAQVKGRRTSPSQRCESGSSIKNQNKKAIRYYKEKNRRENKTYGRVTPRGMSIRKKTRTHKNIIAVEDTKEEENSHKSPSDHHNATVFKKSNSDLKMIRKAVKKNLLFDDLDPDDLSHLIDAFERIEVAKGQKIVTQGDRGYFFFIVGKDSSVTFHLNGTQTGKAMEGGSFGELALMYSCRRAATVVATTSPTVLFRVARKTFKCLLREQTDSREAQKIDLLKGVDFLSEISERDINRLARAMTFNIFKCDDVIVRKGDEGDAFYIVNEGILEVQNISVGSHGFRNAMLESGEYFGERALITNEPRAAHVIADTKGSVFRIERKIFERILGKFGRVIMKAQDRKILEGMDAFESSHLTKSQFEELANLVVDKKFEPKEKIFTHRKRTNAALYIIREGTIRLKGSRSGLIKPGAYFGEDLLLLDTRQEVEKSKRASTKTLASYTAIAEEECLCGILSLSECRTIFDTSEMLKVKLGVDLRALSEEFKSEEFTNEEELIECSLGPRINCRRTSTEWLEKESKNALRHAVESNVTFEDLRRHDKLGEGQFGEVFLASAYVSSEYDKQVFALKTQKKVDPMRGDSTELIKREIELLACMDHPYIVNLIHYYEYSEEIYILMGAVYGGELFDVIHSENSDGTWSSGIPEKDARFYAMVLADTLDYIHRKQLVHRDLKPENVLIDEDGYPIICDFGFAKYVPDKTYTLCGTPNYLSPEVIMNRGHDSSVDHWALGVLIYEMVAGDNPFFYDGISQMKLFRYICKEEFYPLPDDASDEVFYVVHALLEKNPTKRLGSLAGRGKDIMAKKWFEGLELDDLRQKMYTAPYIPVNDKMDHLL